MLIKLTPLIASARAILKGSRTIHGAKISAWGHACQPKQVFKDRALFFFSVCEESSLQMKNAKKLLYQFFDYEGYNL